MLILSWFFLFAVLLLSWQVSENPHRAEGFWSIFVVVLGTPVFALFAVAEVLLTLS